MFGRYRRSPAVVTNPAILNAPQMMVDPQDPNDPLGYGYDDGDAYGGVGAFWHSREKKDELRAKRAKKRRAKARYLESIGKDERAGRMRKIARRLTSKIESEGLVVGSIDAVTGQVIPAWYTDTSDFLDAVEDQDAGKTFGAMKRLHDGMHAGTYGDFGSEAVPEGAGIVIGNLNDGYFRKFGTANITNPAMLPSPMADFGSNLGDPSDVAYGVEGIVVGNLNDGYFRKFGTANITNPAMLVSPMGDFGSNIGSPYDVAYGVGDAGEDEGEGDLFGSDVFFNERGNLRSRSRTKHFAKKDAIEGRKAIKETQRGLRQAERSLSRIGRRFERAEEAEPSYADEPSEADKVLNLAGAYGAGGYGENWYETNGYGVGALEGEAAFAEASRILDMVGLPAEDGPGDSAMASFENPRQLRRAAGAIAIAAERMSQEPMWLYADGETMGLALSLEPFPDELGWTLVGVANGADPNAEAAEAGFIPLIAPIAAAFGAKKYAQKQREKREAAKAARQNAQAAEAGALYYGTANITNPAMLTSPMADFDEDLGSPFSVRY